MSNFLAISTVTATLQRTLQANIQMDVDGARVTTVRPSDIGNGTPETGVNIFLYQVISNPALTNIDATPLRSKGNPTKRQAALDLYYMLSFYGNDNELAPQRLLGSAIRTLNDVRVIPYDMIRDTCEDTTFTFLQDSDLADQIQRITLMPLDLNLEDLSKTWTVFFQTPYVLSVAYKALVVLIEGDEPYRRALPIRERPSGGLSSYFNQPVVEQVLSQAGRFEPILLNSTLVIKGKQLKGGYSTQVLIGGAMVVPESVSATEVVLPLASVPMAALRAGVQSLQVVHPPFPSGNGPQRLGVESNAAPFVLRPIVQNLAVSEVEGVDDDPRSAVITVQVNMLVGQRQRVVLFLNEWAVSDPVAYAFDGDLRDRETDVLTVSVRDTKAGDYLVRLQIDGAESQLEVDDTEGSPTKDWYVGPRITIP